MQKLNANSIFNKIWKKRAWVIICAFLLFVTLVYTILGEKSYLAIHDNLDLFQAQFQMMKNTGTFFSHGVSVPFLHGISRDCLPSELSLTTLLYVIFPSFAAYVINYLLKVVIAIVGFALLTGKLLPEDYLENQTIVLLAGLGYGILNVFPCFGIPFASIPLMIYLVLRIDESETWKKALPWLGLLFLYPFLSYFSYFGLFLCGYLAVAVIWVSVARRRFAGKLLGATIVLSTGYVVFEYRLFGMMLLSDEVTIRSTMVGTDFSIRQVQAEIVDVFCKGIFHADAVHTKLILPIVLAWFVLWNGNLIRQKRAKQIFQEPFNLVMLLLVFNSVVYGIYDYSPVRTLIETLVPPLEGWQFNRTVFFNPFLWYAALLLIALRLGKLKSYLGELLILGAMLTTLLSNTRYNDLYQTCYYNLRETVTGTETDLMNYEEFYGSELFAKVKEEIGYQGEWAAAYGFHPAVLEYNGIATLDGYLGFYSQEYKEQFRKMIAPAIDRVEASRIYFDEWGARAYLFSGSEDSVVSPYKSFTITDTELYLDGDAFAALDGVYLFSRYELTRTKEAGMEYVGAWSDDKVPYSIYVYRAVEGE